MRFYLEAITAYLDAKFADWDALITGVLSGVVGIVGLAFLVGVLFGMGQIITFMPFIVCFCAANAGYKGWEKSVSPRSQHRRVICGLAGLGTGAAGYLTQLQIDQLIFHAQTPLVLLFFFLIAGGLMAEAGGWLKGKSGSIKG
jgi:hypothetical protein